MTVHKLSISIHCAFIFYYILLKLSYNPIKEYLNQLILKLLKIYLIFNAYHVFLIIKSLHNNFSFNENSAQY